MLAAIGTVESMLTMKIVDANTGTLGWGNRQEFAVGFANVVAGLLGGMGGTAMIGLSTIVRHILLRLGTKYIMHSHNWDLLSLFFMDLYRIA
jgi:hypothetical protein